MNPLVARRAASLAVGWVMTLSVLWTLGAPTALGALTRRTWHATIGGTATGGSSVLAINLDMSGTLSLTMRGLRPSTQYTEMIYTGTCAMPHAVVRLPGFLTDATGSGSRTTALTRGQGNAIWAVASGASIAFRVATGLDAHCAVLSYAIATRVAISRFGIDLPVLLQQGQAFPYCNVAMYLPYFSQPGERGPTFIYAHARTGMFLPLLHASLVNNGNSMLGMKVRVWTSDGIRRTYLVTHVWRHVYSVPAYDPKVEQLWLQTSEGPYGTYNKLFLVAEPISTTGASYADAHPTPHPIVCGLYK